MTQSPTLIHIVRLPGRAPGKQSHSYQMGHPEGLESASQRPRTKASPPWTVDSLVDTHKRTLDKTLNLLGPQFSHLQNG